ncbi:MAG: glutathione S-transferase family protein [Betaproteobacteria bacterium]|nr:glutathione S-transferase family protein [Betaproteobacteria bacterium]
MKLVIGNKNYSSWSLRPWLAMKVAGIAFEEERIPLYLPESKARILAVNPAGKVPCLVDGALRVWDSLSILEYLAETHPQLWPADRAARALARSVSAEMHSGFAQLRTHMSMNIRRSLPGRGRTPESLAEAARIMALWSDCRARHGAGGPFLFGAFSNADAMYAPVVLRFRTYAVELPPDCDAYAQAVLALPAMREWIAAAERETESIPQFEQYP